MTVWRDFNDGKKTYPMSHLRPFTLGVTALGTDITLNVTFGWHVFTDEKAKGPRFSWGNGKETRYFCPERHNSSFQVVDFIKNRMIAAHCCPYIDYAKAEKYYCSEDYDLAMFFTIQQPHGSANTLNLRVVSAYEVDQWGKQTLPSGNWKKMEFVLATRNQGKMLI